MTAATSSLARLGLAHVAGDRQALAAGGADRRRRLLEQLGAAAGDRDTRAERGQQLRRRAADAGAAARHERRAAGQAAFAEDAVHRTMIGGARARGQRERLVHACAAGRASAACMADPPRALGARGGA